MRKIEFQNGCYYHIYNRGVDKRNIFDEEKDYVRFIVSMREFNRIEPIESLYTINKMRGKAPKALYRALGATDAESLIEIIAYVLMPNHYHLILKQKIDGSIAKFMQKLGAGYTSYYNFKNNRTGALFQGTYKSAHIETDEYLQYLSCYINGDSEIHKIAKAENYIWSSYKDYLGERNGTLSNKKTILNDFKDINEYKDLTDYVIEESGERKDEIKKYLLE